MALDVAITVGTKGFEGFVGDAAPMGIGVAIDVVKEIERRNEGRRLLDLMNTVDYAIAFNLIGCIVTYETITTSTSVGEFGAYPTTQSSNTVYLYPSLYTQHKIDWLNDYLSDNNLEIDGYNGTTSPITIDDVLNNPEGVEKILNMLNDLEELYMGVLR